MKTGTVDVCEFETVTAVINIGEPDTGVISDVTGFGIEGARGYIKGFDKRSAMYDTTIA